MRAVSSLGAGIFQNGPVCLQPTIASLSFANLPAAGTSSGSSTRDDEIFTILSTRTTAPTIVEGQQSRFAILRASLLDLPSDHSWLLSSFPGRDLPIVEPVEEQPVLRNYR